MSLTIRLKKSIAVKVFQKTTPILTTAFNKNPASIEITSRFFSYPHPIQTTTTTDCPSAL